jgi:hypothetical protein
MCSVSDKNDVTMKVSSFVEQPSSKKDEVIVSKSRPSSIASQRPSKPSEGIYLLHFIFN